MKTKLLKKLRSNIRLLKFINHKDKVSFSVIERVGGDWYETPKYNSFTYALEVYHRALKKRLADVDKMQSVIQLIP